jgi:hypothetical protein
MATNNTEFVEYPFFMSLGDCPATRPTNEMKCVIDEPKSSGANTSRDVILSLEVNLRGDRTGAIILNNQYYIIYVQGRPDGYAGSLHLQILFPVTLANIDSVTSTQFLQLALDTIYNDGLSLTENKEHTEAYEPPCTVSTTVQSSALGEVTKYLELDVLYRGPAGLQVEPRNPRSGEKPLREKYKSRFRQWVTRNGGDIYDKAKDDFKIIQKQHQGTLGTYIDKKELLRFYGLRDFAPTEKPMSRVEWTAPDHESFGERDLYEAGGRYASIMAGSNGRGTPTATITCQRAYDIAIGDFRLAFRALNKKYKVCFPWYSIDTLKDKSAYDIAFLVDRQRKKLTDKEIIDFYNAAEYAPMELPREPEKDTLAHKLKTSLLGLKHNKRRVELNPEEEARLGIKSSNDALRYWRKRGFNLMSLPRTWEEFFPELDESYWPEPEPQSVPPQQPPPKYRY